MIISIDDQIHFEVTFDPLDREEGFAIHEPGPANLRRLAVTTTSIRSHPIKLNCWLRLG
jgi:hypothetical protein